MERTAVYILKAVPAIIRIEVTLFLCVSPSPISGLLTRIREMCLRLMGMVGARKQWNSVFTASSVVGDLVLALPPITRVFAYCF